MYTINLITVVIIFAFAHSATSTTETTVAPVVVAMEHAATSTPMETRLGDDGVGYTWAEFESYYFDAKLAAEIWEAAEVVAAPEPISPRFEPGSIVRVLADTTPVVSIPSMLRESLWRRSLISLLMGITSND